MIERWALLALVAMLLGACGSRPVHQPQVLTNSRSDMTLGMQAYQDNRYAEARNFFSRALGEYRSVDDRAGALDALIDLADSALGQGEYAAAQTYLQDADTITADGNFTALKSRIVLLTAYAHMQAGENRQAATQLDTLLNDATTPADIHQAALFARTQTAFDLQASDAQSWLDKLGALSGKNTDVLSTARYQRLQALGARQAGNAQQAATLYRSALNAYRAAYYRPGIAATLEEWAALSMQQKDWRSARNKLQRALNVRLSMNDRTHSGSDLENLAQIDTALGDSARAKQDAQLADYLKKGGDLALLPASSPSSQGNPD